MDVQSFILYVVEPKGVGTAPISFIPTGETSVTTDSIDITPQIQATLKSSRKRRLDRTLITSSIPNPDYSINNNSVNNNNNHVKNERLSPSTPDTSSRSPSITPSSVSHPGTPPANETPLLPGVRNCSDFMRSLAAKYNNASHNDYFNAVKNGFAPPMDPRFKSASFPVMSTNTSISTNNKENDLNNRKPDYSSIINPFVTNPLFSSLIDMSSSQTLAALARSAKEAEVQDIMKNVKRPEPSSPLDLSAAAQLSKKMKQKRSNATSPSAGLLMPKRMKSESPHMREDIKNWTVDDVYNFVSSIDICAEYSQNFRDQRIDGSGLPLLTEEHLTSTMNMKLGPALKFKSVLAKKMGSCNICLHCTHCHHNSASPEPANTTGNSSDSGGTS
ncbi:hypothetical protein WA026_001703 [Henosepilachna vigintioctopunctata]|uniref:SAM domain-containing protein n=1 Tax=Henosepilachna vigintioctopunctata TaxID=420089 RepID=A0AAW1UQP6_9CUCU